MKPEKLSIPMLFVIQELPDVKVAIFVDLTAKSLSFIGHKVALIDLSFFIVADAEASHLPVDHFPKVNPALIANKLDPF